MTSYRNAIPALLLAAALCIPHLMAAPDAEAARVGGGRSFGGSPTYSRPAPSPTPRVAQPAPGQQSFSRQQTPMGTPMGQPRSGFGGMMGGLLAGSLLGALFFGGGFSGLGFADMILFAVLAFVGLKLLRAMRGRAQNPAPAGAARSSHPPYPEASPRAAANDPWERMRSSPQQQGPASSGGFEAPGQAGPAFDRYGDAAETGAAPAAGSIPAGFKQEDFLRGAKMAFTRLQESWDKRDLDDIARFATEAIMREVRDQAKADPGPSRTDILLINASLVSVANEGKDEVASVFFDVLLREDPKAEAPTQVREIWHFIRPANSSESWKLDGIQQVEN